MIGRVTDLMSGRVPGGQRDITDGIIAASSLFSQPTKAVRRVTDP